jgi:hypothetical protein
MRAGGHGTAPLRIGLPGEVARFLSRPAYRQMRRYMRSGPRGIDTDGGVNVGAASVQSVPPWGHGLRVPIHVPEQPKQPPANRSQRYHVPASFPYVRWLGASLNPKVLGSIPSGA